MDNAKQQLTERLKTANNVLVTVSRNPSVDQLASCIGLTLLLNKQGKHAAAVFSGEIPSTLEFLGPEDTLEKNTDSLRDFIIALDKSKADKLRYKVEDNIVRIFITPYKTSISEADLEFSEGDFNVDVVIALGVQKQEDLDEAITAHGRILHDATVASINTTTEGGLGTINWHDSKASSLSELITELSQALGADLLDNQISTSLLTGIVSETNRFSNDKTSSQTMSAGAILMAAGANQQLVASKLEIPPSATSSSGVKLSDNKTPANDGMIEIEHNDAAAQDMQPGAGGLPANLSAAPLPGAKAPPAQPAPWNTQTANGSQEKPAPAGGLSGLPATDLPQTLDLKPGPTAGPSPLNPPQSTMPAAPPAQPPVTPSAGAADLTPPPPSWTPPPSPPAPGPAASQPVNQPAGSNTLAELEKAVDSSHAYPEKDLDVARDEVSRALSASTTDSTTIHEPIQALNAQPLGSELHPNDLPVVPAPAVPQTAMASPVNLSQQSASSNDPAAPPPVPPPIPFQPFQFGK